MGRRVTPPKHVISPTWGTHSHVNRTRALQALSSVYSLKPIYVYSTKHNVTKIAIEWRLSLKQAQYATTTRSQEEIVTLKKWENDIQRKIK